MRLGQSFDLDLGRVLDNIIDKSPLLIHTTLLVADRKFVEVKGQVQVLGRAFGLENPRFHLLFFGFEALLSLDQSLTDLR